MMWLQTSSWVVHPLRFCWPFENELSYQTGGNIITVKPLYKGYAWDIKLGLCREVGCLWRLLSIVVIIFLPLWWR